MNEGGKVGGRSLTFDETIYTLRCCRLRLNPSTLSLLNILDGHQQYCPLDVVIVSCPLRIEYVTVVKFGVQQSSP